MAKLQELSLFDVIGERKNRYEFSFVTTFNAYLPFYEQIVLRHLTRAGCRVSTLLMDAGHFAAAVSDPSAAPNLAGRDYTLIPVSAAGGVFHPKILLLLGSEHAALCVGSHNLTLSGFGKNRELTTVYEINSGSGDDEKQIFRDVWKALRFWTKNQPDELLDAMSFAEKEIAWLTEANDADLPRNSDFYSAPNENELSLWDQIKTTLPAKARRVTLISPFFDENLSLLRRIKNDLNPDEFVVGIEPATVHLTPRARLVFPDIQFVETTGLRENRGYLHAKSIYIESEEEENILIVGSANVSGAAWLGAGGGGNYEAVVVYRSKEAVSAAKAIGLDKLFRCAEIKDKDWQIIESNNIKRDQQEMREDAPLVFSAIETNFGFRITAQERHLAFDQSAELVDADGKTIYTGEITQDEHRDWLIFVEDAQIRSATKLIKLVAGEKAVIALAHHTPTIVAKFHKTQYREFFTALEGFDLPIDEKFWRLFEKVIFVEGDNLPDYLDAQISSIVHAQNLRVKTAASESETLQKTFSVKTADLDFKERLYRNSLDGIGEFLGFLNRRLAVPSDFFQASNSPSFQAESDSDWESDSDQTEEIFDPAFEIERIAGLYYQRSRTMMRRISKKMSASREAENSCRFALVRQLAVVLSVLHWVRRLEQSEKFAKCETAMIEVEDEWKLFVESVAFISTLENFADEDIKSAKRFFSDEWATVVGHLLWLAFDCGFDVAKLDELRRQNYGEERSDGWTNEEVLEGAACFLKLAVYLPESEAARQIFEKLLENEDSADWKQSHAAWLQTFGERSKDITSLPALLRSARTGDFAYQTKMKKSEILVVADSPGNVEVVFLSAENRRRKYSAATVAVLDI